MRKVELLPTRDCEAGYGPGNEPDMNTFYVVLWVQPSFIENNANYIRLVQLVYGEKNMSPEFVIFITYCDATCIPQNENYFTWNQKGCM